MALQRVSPQGLRVLYDQLVDWRETDASGLWQHGLGGGVVMLRCCHYWGLKLGEPSSQTQTSLQTSVKSCSWLLLVGMSVCYACLCFPASRSLVAAGVVFGGKGRDG